MKNLILITLGLLISFSTIAMADNFDEIDNFYLRPSYNEIKALERLRPAQARAYIRGVADTVFAFVPKLMHITS
jgi:hypothetical protein